MNKQTDIQIIMMKPDGTWFVETKRGYKIGEHVTVHKEDQDRQWVISYRGAKVYDYIQYKLAMQFAECLAGLTLHGTMTMAKGGVRIPKLDDISKKLVMSMIPK